MDVIVMSRTFRKCLIQDHQNKIYFVHHYEFSSGKFKSDYIRLPKQIRYRRTDIKYIVDSSSTKDNGRYAKNGYYHKIGNRQYRLKLKHKLNSALGNLDYDDLDYNISKKHLKLRKIHVKHGQPLSAAFLDKH